MIIAIYIVQELCTIIQIAIGWLYGLKVLHIGGQTLKIVFMIFKLFFIQMVIYLLIIMKCLEISPMELLEYRILEAWMD